MPDLILIKPQPAQPPSSSATIYVSMVVVLSTSRNTPQAGMGRTRSGRDLGFRASGDP